MDGRKAWFALAVLFGINLLNFFDRTLPGSLGEPIRKEFALSDTALGFLGTVFTLIYAAVGVPLGRLTDRWVRTRLISIGVIAWSLLTAASGLAWNYTSLFITRLGVGVGEASCAPASQSLIGDLFPSHQRARALGVFMLGLPIGLFLAYIISGWLGQALGWRAVFLLACLPGLAMGGLVLLIPEPHRGITGAKSVFEPASLASPYKAVLGLPTMWWIIASGALHNFNMYAINAFQTPFLQRFHGLTLREASNISAVVLGAVGIAGLLFGGWASDRLSERRVDGRLLLSACTMLAAAPCVYLAIGQPAGEITAFTLLMGLGIMMTFVYYATIYAAIQDVVDPRLRGTAVALYFLAMYVLGASLGPVGLGALSDRFARHAMHAAGATQMQEAFRAQGLHDAMYVIPALMLLASLVLFAGAHTIKGDIRKRDAARSITAA
jgi:MFS family permease